MTRSVLAALVGLTLLVGVGTTLAPAQSGRAGDKRVALVIGNGRYAESPLNNPVNDARAVARVLRTLGFDVLAHENLDFISMRRAVAGFGERMAEGGVGLFYYSGHGLQVGGRNFLVPIAARLTSERYITAETLEVDAVLKEMDAARNRLNVVILDACRDNPFARGWRSASRGLAQMSGPPGTFIAYATDPGDVAADGVPGSNGVYTGELLGALPLRGLSIEEVFKRTARGVMSKTNNKQRPWVASSFTGEFQFVAGAPVPPAAPSRPPAAVAAVPTPAPEPSVTREVIREYGSLAIRGRLAGIEVYLDDRRIGETERGTALVLNNLPIGMYRVKARKDGHRDWAREVQVVVNQRAEVLIDIEALKPEPPKPLKAEDGAEMVLVPAGEFVMGSEEYDNEKPRHRVHLDGFHIDKYEVTNALYQRFMSATGHQAPAYWSDSTWNGAQQPVVGVSWHDADAYCRWAGKRLPAEAQWEKAARGTDGRKYPWGEHWDASRANSGESKLGKTTAVGSYPRGASSYGAFDMAGNAWEWVADWYDGDYYKRSPERNPPGAESGSLKVLRGGSWYGSALNLRSSDRSYDTPDNRDFNLGFRCARGLP
jgi:formylglycine-generating enzyme required for sulfatase activity